MKRVGVLTMAILLVPALVGCGGEGEGAEQEEAANNRVEIGGFVVLGPNGEEIFVPEATAERDDVQTYLDSVRPVIEDTSRDLSQVIDPSVELQGQTLSLSIEVESIERADEAVEDGLEALQSVEPPEGLDLVHDQLVAAYERALPAYDDVLEAFGSGDANALAEEVREGLPEIEQFTATTRAILQELDRAANQETG